MPQKTQEEYNSELDKLVADFQKTDQSQDEFAKSAAAGLAAIIAYQVLLGKCIPYPPGILGPLKALPDFVVETLGGQEILDKLEEPEKAVTDQLAKMMSFIQLIISFATGGLFPPLPNLDIVKLYLAYLQRLAGSSSDSSSDSSAGSGAGGDGTDADKNNNSDRNSGTNNDNSAGNLI